MAGVLTGGELFFAHPGAHDPALRPRHAFTAPDGVRDIYDGGPGRIIGQAPGLVTYDGIPGRALVHLCDYPTMRIVRSTRSAADGTYALEHLRTDRPYVVVAFDETRNDNAVILDRVQAGPP